MAEVAEDLTTAGLPVEFSPDGQDFTLSAPITKIDHEKRIVEGIASSEREDSQNDVVSLDASVTAFSAWPGNIREQHMPKAVGHRVSQEFDHANRLVKVRAFISRGAQDTWLKLTEDPCHLCLIEPDLHYKVFLKDLPTGVGYVLVDLLFVPS